MDAIDKLRQHPQIADWEQPEGRIQVAILEELTLIRKALEDVAINFKLRDFARPRSHVR